MNGRGCSHGGNTDVEAGGRPTSVGGGDAEPDGRGTPLVLVPGMDGTGRLFFRQVPLLASAFRVTTFSLRDDADRMETLIDDLAAFVRGVTGGVNGRRAVICGESFGGALALSFALRHPELVRALIIVNSFPHFRPQFRLHAAMAGIQLMPWGAMAFIRRLTAFRMHSRHTHRVELRRFLEETRTTTKRGYLNRLRILTRYDVLPSLPELRSPTLFLAADRDHLVPAVAQARLMASRAPNATVRVLEGHGHICMIAPNLDLAQLIAEWGELNGEMQLAP